MPEIFRAFGFSFFFYSREHEPIHIHVEGKGGAARYVLNNETFVLAELHGINKSDLRKNRDDDRRKQRYNSKIFERIFQQINEYEDRKDMV